MLPLLSRGVGQIPGGIPKSKSNNGFEHLNPVDGKTFCSVYWTFLNCSCVFCSQFFLNVFWWFFRLFWDVPSPNMFCFDRPPSRPHQVQGRMGPKRLGQGVVVSDTQRCFEERNWSRDVSWKKWKTNMEPRNVQFYHVGTLIFYLRCAVGFCGIWTCWMNEWLILLLLMSVQSFKTVDADKNNQMYRCKKKCKGILANCCENNVKVWFSLRRVFCWKMEITVKGQRDTMEQNMYRANWT